MSQSRLFRWAAAVACAGCGSSCALLKDKRFADTEKADKGPGSELISPMTADGSKRLMDIRATQPRQGQGWSVNPASAGGIAATPPATLTGIENFEVLPSAGNGLFPGDANPDEPSWRAVPVSPLRLNPVSESGHRMPADYDTVQAVVNALPALTGASLAEPYLLAKLTASTAPAMAAAFSGAAVEATPSPATPGLPDVPAPAAPVMSAGPQRRAAPGTGGQPEAFRPRVAGMLSSEHEAE